MSINRIWMFIDYTRCATGWKGWKGNCYLFRVTQLSMLDAEAVCHNAGGHLLSILTADEHEFIKTSITSKSK